MESTNIFMKHTSWTWKIWIHGLISIYFIICNCIALDYEVTRDLTDTFDKADIASCDSITGAEQDRTSQTKCKCLKDGTLTTNNDGSLFCIKDYGTSIGMKFYSYYACKLEISVEVFPLKCDPFDLLLYTILQNKRMRRRGVSPTNNFRKT